MRTGEDMDLRRTQELFWELITARREGHRIRGDSARGGDTPQRHIDEVFAGGGRLAAAERVEIYANMYFFRLLDCLGEDFPKLRGAIGEDHFRTLAADYLALHPSEDPSLRHLGRRLPGFVATHPLSADFPWLADLARLEWARADVFDAADAVPLTREALARLPQERAGEAAFVLIPALAIVRFDHDVVRLWRLLEETADHAGAHHHATANAARGEDAPCAPAAAEGGRLDPPARRPTAARVWRKDFVVYHASMDDEEAIGLEQARAGADIARLCQNLAAGRSVARATERAGRLIQTWMDDGLLAGVTLPG